MKKGIPTYKRIYSVIFSISTVLIILAVIILSGRNEKNYSDELKSFSSGWVSLNGDVHNIDKLRTRHFERHVVLMHELPVVLSSNDCLCFETANVNIRVFIDTTEVYNFTTRENLSGMGYGTAFHMVGLSKHDAGKTVEIHYRDVYEGYGEGRVTDVYIGPAEDYIRLKASQRALATIFSVIILIFGILMIVAFLWISDKNSMPFDIAGLGVAAALLGIWLLLDTNMIQLLFGFVITCRVFNRVTIFLIAFPLTCFFNSLSEQKREIYNVISLVGSAILLAAMLILRYLVGIDMTESFVYCVAIYLVMFFAIILSIFIDNILYCRAHGIALNLGFILLGNAILLVCAGVDLVLYISNIYKANSFGAFTRVGALIFISIMMLQFLRWWTSDQESIGRDRFIYKVMQYAIASDSSEESVKAILEYIGKEFNAGGVIIFEEQENRKYHGTYEWLTAKREQGNYELLYLPYEGLIDTIYSDFAHNNNRLVIDDIEKYRGSNFSLYNILSNYHLSNLVASPIEVTDRLLGLLVIFDIPADLLGEAAEITDLSSYFISQLLLRRDEEKRLKAYIYNDALTGAYNRRAFREFIDNMLDISSPFGYIACEIAGLEKTNKTKGFDSGDKMLIEAANHLMEVFGKENVYRISGVELVAFGFETEELFFYNDIERFRKLAGAKGLKMYIGAVYCIYGTKDVQMVIDRAGYKLRQEKEE